MKSANASPIAVVRILIIQKKIVIRGTLLNLYCAGAVNPRCRISRVATATGCHTYLNGFTCLNTTFAIPGETQLVSPGMAN
jgi:hypothetical protein